MRVTTFTVYNNQKVEIFVEKRENYFEYWMVGPIKEHRTVLTHYLADGDIEALLEYSNSGDLIWRDATRSEIPIEKNQNAIEMEETIERGVIWDRPDDWIIEVEQAMKQGLSEQYENQPTTDQPTGDVCGLLRTTILFLATDKKEMKIAKNTILGRWTDGIVTLSLEPDHKLGWSCNDQNDSLNIGDQIHGHPPDWWNFDMWNLTLLNDKYKCGIHFGVLRVDEKELHIDGDVPHRLARVFQRI